MNEINLNEWKWLRKIDGNDVENVQAYLRMARKNKVLMVEIYGEYAYNIYIPETITPTKDNGILTKGGGQMNIQSESRNVDEIFETAFVHCIECYGNLQLGRESKKEAKAQLKELLLDSLPKKVDAEMPNATTVAYNRCVEETKVNVERLFKEEDK